MSTSQPIATSTVRALRLLEGIRTSNKVWVSTTAPTPGQVIKEECIPTNRLSRKIGDKFHYIAQYSMDKNLLAKLPLLLEFGNNLPIKQIVRHPHDCFVLVPMNVTKDMQPGELGYTVHYRKNQRNPIPAHTAIMHYHGKLVEYSLALDPTYIFNITNELCLDASKQGGLGRFIGHLPTELELKLLDIDDSLQGKIATANLSMNQHGLNGELSLALVSTKQISAGEMLGYSYSYNYFLSQKTWPVFYTKQGLAIEPGLTRLNCRRYAIMLLIDHTINEWNNITVFLQRMTDKLTPPQKKTARQFTVSVKLLFGSFQSLYKPDTKFNQFEILLMRIIPSILNPKTNLTGKLTSLLSEFPETQKLIASLTRMRIRLSSIEILISENKDKIKSYTEQALKEHSEKTGGIDLTQPHFLISEYHRDQASSGERVTAPAFSANISLSLASSSSSLFATTAPSRQQTMSAAKDAGLQKK